MPLSEVTLADKLFIEINEGPDLLSLNKTNVLEINARGLVDGQRGKSDGCVIIGSRG